MLTMSRKMWRGWAAGEARGSGVAAHPAAKQPIEAAGDSEQRHVEVDLQTDRGRECVHVKEADGVGDRVLNEHALGVAGDEALEGGIVLVGEEDGRLVVPKVLDEQLAQGATRELH